MANCRDGLMVAELLLSLRSNRRGIVAAPPSETGRTAAAAEEACALDADGVGDALLEAFIAPGKAGARRIQISSSSRSLGVRGLLAKLLPLELLSQLRLWFWLSEALLARISTSDESKNCLERCGWAAGKR